MLAVVVGDGQNGRTSEALSEPLVVQATVDLGLDEGVPLTENIQPVEGLEIDWAITSGVATLSTARSVTDENGAASVQVTPGPLLGDIEVTATAVAENGVSVQFALRTTVYLIDILIDRFEVPLGGDSIEVAVGDTVEWVNRDALRHAVSTTSVPPGGFEFRSPDLANSQRYRFVPKVEGTFRYEDPLNVNAVRPTGRISVVGRDVGGLTIATSTSGQNPDHAYVVTVDGTRSSAIGAADEVTFPALSATTHAVRLLEVEANCAVSGANPRPVTVLAADTVTTTFEVTCE
jgi:plastocyanin